MKQQLASRLKRFTMQKPSGIPMQAASSSNTIIISMSRLHSIYEREISIVVSAQCFQKSISTNL